MKYILDYNFTFLTHSLESNSGLISKAYQAAVETQSTAAVKHLLGKILKEDTVKALQVSFFEVNTVKSRNIYVKFVFQTETFLNFVYLKQSGTFSYHVHLFCYPIINLVNNTFITSFNIAL